jgi:hypothetical protein
MIQTEIVGGAVPTVVQRMTGVTDRLAVERGLASALELITQVIAKHASFDLLLDLRDLHFADLLAHRAWRVDFLAHPSIVQHIRCVAIIGNDTPPFQAERQLMETERCRFFVDRDAGQAWLAALN